MKKSRAVVDLLLAAVIAGCSPGEPTPYVPNSKGEDAPETKVQVSKKVAKKARNSPLQTAD
jgi:hypothetical protein